MIEPWILFTIAAAFFQNLRSAVQKHLKGALSNSGAAYARFLYALPVALLYCVAVREWFELPYPAVNFRFLVFCFLGGICQILFTVVLLWMFSFRSFAVGTTLSKLEVVMIAILGAIVLGDQLNGYAIVAILISAVGLIALTLGQNRLSWRSALAGLTEKATLIGFVCAAFLGGSVVFFRGAALALDYDHFLLVAAFTLAVSLLMQTVIMGAYLLLREAGEFARVLKHWRWAGLAGLVGAAGSIGWFTAFTLQNASFVRAVGQIELVFTFLASTMIFRERVSRLETLGIFFIALGIVILLLAG